MNLIIYFYQPNITDKERIASTLQVNDELESRDLRA